MDSFLISRNPIIGQEARRVRSTGIIPFIGGASDPAWRIICAERQVERSCEPLIRPPFDREQRSRVIEIERIRVLCPVSDLVLYREEDPILSILQQRKKLILLQGDWYDACVVGGMESLCGEHAAIIQLY